MPSYKELKNPRQWQAAIGISEKQFLFLTTQFQITYQTLFGVSISDKQKNLDMEFIFKTYEDNLFFLLFFLKNPLTFDVLGFIFGTAGSNAQRIIDKLMPVLSQTLSDNQLLPARNFKDLEQFMEHLHSNTEITIDVTEMSIQRPADNQEQKKFYSGKKKDIQQNLL